MWSVLQWQGEPQQSSLYPHSVLGGLLLATVGVCAHNCFMLFSATACCGLQLTMMVMFQYAKAMSHAAAMRSSRLVTDVCEGGTVPSQTLQSE